ncbi:uncharacterized protein LOC116384858 [Anarrhichthys ocellatus]|uniref:uncharacterized protein LOC116384858 n=1 Tax=Anarrhichthys ocellatus TaxID=433405 RepID=UPI0012EE286B|nr:uncharacterized protein LOC116384858 [Anarrhichthys ocellatus]XP_031705718.1 uncharacterized protein LOC116384858 [Anarrhichthys ocellatus]
MVRFQISRLSVKNGKHEVIHAGSVVLAVIAQVISDIFCNLAEDGNVPNALFQTSSRNVTETFPLEVTMDWWSDSYWVIIDLWSKAWLLYAVVNLFKRNVLGPDIHPPVFYLMWTIINIARMCRMSLWDRHDILEAVILGWILPVLSFYMLYMSYSNLNKHKAWLAINNPRVISWTCYLTQNGLAVFAWWSLLNAVVGLGIVLKYKACVPDPLMSTIVLTIVSLCAIIWFILQSCPLAKYMRYTFSVYAILILGLGAMFTRSYRFHDLAPNTAYCGFLMLLMTIMSLIHLISVCLHKDKSSKPGDTEPYVAFKDCETVWHTDLRTDNAKNDLCKI